MILFFCDGCGQEFQTKDLADVTLHEGRFLLCKGACYEPVAIAAVRVLDELKHAAKEKIN